MSDSSRPRSDAKVTLMMIAIITVLIGAIYGASYLVSGNASSSQGESTGLPVDLQLGLSLSPTSMSTGQSIRISVQETNSLSSLNNVTVARDWAEAYLTVSPCGTLSFPMGYAILSGYYTASNISSGESLNLYEPGPYNCPLILSGIDSYAFLPLSSTAAVYGSCEPEPCFSSFNVNSTGSVSGSWSGNSTDNSQFSSFAQGTYTVVAGDEWGHLVFAYFSVS